MALIVSVIALDCLTLFFTLMKVTNNLNWSWWLVTAPFWSQFVIMIVFVTLVFIYLIVRMVINFIKKRWLS